MERKQKRVKDDRHEMEPGWSSEETIKNQNNPL